MPSGPYRTPPVHYPSRAARRSSPVPYLLLLTVIALGVIALWRSRSNHGYVIHVDHFMRHGVSCQTRTWSDGALEVVCSE